MPPNDDFPETPSEPHASLLLSQREANEQLLLAALRAHEDADEANSSRMVAESESDLLRMKAADLAATAEFRERLLGIIGHDLRNPLNSMVVAAQLLRKKDHFKEADVRLLDRVVDSGMRMGRMIDQLANFTRARLGGGFELNVAPCDVGEICLTVIAELRLSSDREIRLDTNGALEGEWDADRLAEVLSNLIGNATRHATPATTVRVRARAVDLGVIVDVHNQGPDIPAELLSTIFSAFARGQHDSRRNDGHLGLGLYVSREVALSHGGTLQVESAEGNTTFTLCLPRLSRVEHPSRAVSQS